MKTRFVTSGHAGVEAFAHSQSRVCHQTSPSNPFFDLDGGIEAIKSSGSYIVFLSVRLWDIESVFKALAAEHMLGEPWVCVVCVAVTVAVAVAVAVAVTVTSCKRL